MDTQAQEASILLRNMALKQGTTELERRALKLAVETVEKAKELLDNA